MATIRSYCGDPWHIKTPYVEIGQAPWPGGGTVPMLVLVHGNDKIELHNVSAESLRELAAKLVALAEGMTT